METAFVSNTPQDVRWNVIHDLQKIMCGSMPGSRPFRIADKAIEFALSPRRNPTRSDYFKRNVWRNAAHAVARSDKSHPEVSLDSLDSAIQTRGIRGKALPVFLPQVHTPEDLLCGSDLHSIISQLSEQSAPGLGAACVSGMVSGDTVQETAAELKVSSKTVKRVRDKIRTVASEITREAA